MLENKENTNMLTKKRPLFKKILKFVSAEDILEAIKKPDEWVIIDVRSQEEYEGIFTNLVMADYGRGRIKNAIHINWFDLVDENFAIKNKEEVKQIFENVIKNKKAILYCHAGIRSGHLQSILIKEFGYDEVYNYDESWNEWSYLISKSSMHEVEDELRQEILKNTENWTEFSKYKFALNAMPGLSKAVSCC